MHSIDESETEEYIKISKKCGMGYMSAYTYADYIDFRNMTDAPNEYHNHFILNQIPDFYITSMLKVMDDTVDRTLSIAARLSHAWCLTRVDDV